MHKIAQFVHFLDKFYTTYRCVRVGGKDCDLEAVGHDGHHHTFFEMMGNWSFNGTYGRKESCAKAWELITTNYELPTDKLFVTYFGGCDELGLGQDLETKETWLELGVSPDRIIPFGAKDNFWQMGVSGPCGPCTEIHYAHSEGAGKHLVNANNDQSVVEVWNLVFMQHFKNLDGSLQNLPNTHVDTGMGLERMTAILNNSRWNYDTDLFQPLFELIQGHTEAKPYSKSFQKYDLIFKYHFNSKSLTSH